MLGGHPGSIADRVVRALLFLCVAGAILPLPFGFLDEDIAVVAAVWGLYIVLPMVVVVASAALARWRRVPVRWTRSVAVVLGVLLVLYFLWWALWTFPFSAVLLAPAAVIWRALRSVT